MLAHDAEFADLRQGVASYVLPPRLTRLGVSLVLASLATSDADSVRVTMPETLSHTLTPLNVFSRVTSYALRTNAVEESHNKNISTQNNQDNNSKQTTTFGKWGTKMIP